MFRGFEIIVFAMLTFMLVPSKELGLETTSTWKEVVTGPYGGQGGIWFTDWWQSLDGYDYHPKRPPQQINVRAGERVDMIQVLYEGYDGDRHGSDGGQLHRLRLFDGDRIIRVIGRAGLGPGAGIDQITFHTLNGRTLGPFGGEGGMKFDSGDFSFSGCHLGYISGQAGMRLDQLSLHWKCPREKEYMGLEEDEDIIPNYSTSNKYSPCDILILFLLISLMCR